MIFTTVYFEARDHYLQFHENMINTTSYHSWLSCQLVHNYSLLTCAPVAYNIHNKRNNPVYTKKKQKNFIFQQHSQAQVHYHSFKGFLTCAIVYDFKMTQNKLNVYILMCNTGYKYNKNNGLKSVMCTYKSNYCQVSHLKISYQ